MIYDKLYPDEIKSINYIGKEPTYCLNVPNGNRFTQNGFVGFNSQGSQWDYPIVFEEPFGDKDMRRRWMYTAITRAAEKLIILRGSPDDIKKT